MPDTKLKGTKFPNVFCLNNELYTPNLALGHSVYGERLITIDEIEYRAWNPRRSKLAALILNGCKKLPIQNDSNILYLGGGNGTTASHISDIVIEGRVYCVEFSARAFRDLLSVADTRENLLPILENASHPERYKTIVDHVDIIYQDISQRNQPDIFLTNKEHFLKPGAYGIFMVKSRSIDMTKPSRDIFNKVKQQLTGAGVKILEDINLSPYTKDHMGLIIEVR
jgi:fibrillarin-like pre-rRNA processing protein